VRGTSVDKRTNQIDLTTKKFIDIFCFLNTEQLNWKPGAETWSVAQNIAHIILLNKYYFEKFENIKQGTNNIRLASRLRYWLKFTQNPIKPYTDTSRIKRAKTYGFWEPAKTDYTHSILTDFQLQQAEFKKYVYELKDVNGKTLMPYPGDKFLVFSLESAFDLLIDHEERHYNQAKELLDRMQMSIP
jgi:uncharacterized damage-inducible protein DinB